MCSLFSVVPTLDKAVLLLAGGAGPSVSMTVNTPGLVIHVTTLSWR